MRHLLALTLAGAFAFGPGAGCATAAALRKESDPAAIRTAAETFHRRVRWKDFEGASSVLVPERRREFLAAREDGHDERDLTISDYELVELRLDPDGTRAEVVSHVSWLRLPSLSEHTDTVVTELVAKSGSWLVARQNKGPFPELQAAYVPEPAPVPVPSGGPP